LNCQHITIQVVTAINRNQLDQHINHRQNIMIHTTSREVY